MLSDDDLLSEQDWSQSEIQVVRNNMADELSNNSYPPNLQGGFSR